MDTTKRTPYHPNTMAKTTAIIDTLWGGNQFNSIAVYVFINL